MRAAPSGLRAIVGVDAVLDGGTLSYTWEAMGLESAKLEETLAVVD